MDIDITIPRHEIDPVRLERMRSELEDRLLHDPGPGGAATKRPPRVRRLTVGLGAAAAAAVAVAVVGQSLVSTPVWAATPDALTGTDLARAVQDCQQSLAHLPNAAQLAQSPAAIGERRGSTTSTLLTGSGAVALCIGDGAGRYGGVVDAVPPPADGGLAVMVSTVVPGESETAVLQGRVGSDVASVQVRTADGRTLTASTSDGYFLAWWPSDAAAETATAFNADGTEVGHLDGAALSAAQAPEPQQP